MGSRSTTTGQDASSTTRTATIPAQGGISSTSSAADQPQTTATQGGGSTNVRVPATFTIRPGGRLVPRTVSAPAFLAVRVTVSSRDGRQHAVNVSTPKPRALSVPAGGRASALIPGQRAGRYAITVDGKRRGALLIGGEPGP